MLTIFTERKDSHVGVQLEVTGLVSKGEVVFSQFRFGSVKGQLVAHQPAFEAQHSGRMDGGTSHVEVQVTAQVHEVPLVSGL